jgi:hypothetical protein
MKYKLQLSYCDEHGCGTLKRIESPIFDFPNPIMPGQSINLYGNNYKLYGQDNGRHILDENGAYTVVDLVELHWESKDELENKLTAIKQDFEKLNRSFGGK